MATNWTSWTSGDDARLRQTCCRQGAAAAFPRRSRVALDNRARTLGHRWPPVRACPVHRPRRPPPAGVAAADRALLARVLARCGPTTDVAAVLRVLAASHDWRALAARLGAPADWREGGAGR
jgi:hypothetical protein